MCTLIALWRCHPSAPLILAANRDELLERPTQDFHLWDSENPRERVIAGKDLRSGGSWLGIGASIVAGLTNHRTSGRSRPGERSRGDLVLRALHSPGLASLQTQFQALPASDFGSFHLLAADAGSMLWITNRSEKMEFIKVAPGPHVLGNYGLDDEHDPVVATLHAELDGILGLDAAALADRLKSILASHGPGRPCVHLGPYGTVSSTLLFWGGAEPRLWTSDGAPCSVPWVDRSALLDARLEVAPPDG